MKGNLKRWWEAYDDNEEVDDLTRVSFDIQNEGVRDVHGRSKNYDNLHLQFTWYAPYK